MRSKLILPTLDECGRYGFKKSYPPIGGASLLAIDASTPAALGHGGVTAGSTITSNTMTSVPANSVIFTFWALDAGSTVANSISSMTDSLGSHLSWSMLVRCNTGVSGQLGGCAEIWYAPCPSAQTSMTVSGTVQFTTSGSTAPDNLVLPVVFTNAATTQNGATNTAAVGTTSGTPSIVVNATTAGSYVFFVLNNWTNGTAPTVGSGQSTTVNGISAQLINTGSGDGYWVQYQTAQTSAPGNVTLNDTAPTNIAYQIAAVEVIPAGAAVADANPISEHYPNFGPF